MIEPVMEPLSIVLIAGSSGSFSLFEKILSQLRSPLSFALIFILHRGKSSKNALPDLFKNKTNVVMKEPYHLDPILPDCIYFPFPDYHLLVGPDSRFYCDRSDRDFFSRPSIDATFVSAAVSGIPVRAAMLFSGSNADGAEGLALLADKGYATYIQDPATAEFPRMPAAALVRCDKHILLKQENFFEAVNGILS
ncbi:chemotaxis protein CheB [Dyadobacter sandarakinus]|uniref:protein-glutamate methylesterase n=1 Tax=Dyadobacter sandarakinus TaxID=2747268 RepID=A0ABX7I2R6_9BACT|nr:chemotaxis protein CheB [Dyadobacter sandarakinus]QRR00376.1 chemotaxis protein CheB [Dyadobacter sandarakinus]